MSPSVFLPVKIYDVGSFTAVADTQGRLNHFCHIYKWFSPWESTCSTSPSPSKLHRCLKLWRLTGCSPDPVTFWRPAIGCDRGRTSRWLDVIVVLGLLVFKHFAVAAGESQQDSKVSFNFFPEILMFYWEFVDSEIKQLHGRAAVISRLFNKSIARKNNPKPFFFAILQAKMPTYFQFLSQFWRFPVLFVFVCLYYCRLNIFGVLSCCSDQIRYLKKCHLTLTNYFPTFHRLIEKITNSRGAAGYTLLFQAHTLIILTCMLSNCYTLSPSFSRFSLSL